MKAQRNNTFRIVYKSEATDEDLIVVRYENGAARIVLKEEYVVPGSGLLLSPDQVTEVADTLSRDQDDWRTKAVVAGWWNLIFIVTTICGIWVW